LCPSEPAQIAAAVRTADRVLGEAFAAVPVARARTFVGLAGTVTTMSALYQELSDYDAERTHLSRLSLPAVTEVAERLVGMTRQERAALGPMHPGRVDVIGAGALIVRAVARYVADTAGVREMVVSEHDILDGIALELA
jgi:exopolyphosphatase/guanosine-5'-triphosphate,3'-diphosphate pyrophosphatase